jgi:hypothetical protein
MVLELFPNLKIPEVGKVTFKSNGDEVLSDDYFRK